MERSLERTHASMMHLQMDGGLRGVTFEELRETRKQKGLCTTCGENRTHKPGLWKSKMPLTVDGLVYKGVCLICSTLDAAKMQLCEPIDSPDDPIAGMKMAAVINRRASIFQHQPRISRYERMSNVAADSIGHCSRSQTEHPARHTRGHSCNKFGSTGQRDRSIQKARNKSMVQPSRITQRNPQNSTDTDSSLETRSKITSNNLLDRLEPAILPPQKGKAFHRGSMTSEGEPNVITQLPPTDISLSSKTKNVNNHHCRDYQNKTGFYTGTLNSQNNLPQGRGEMVYDDGNIVKGVWSKGILKVKIAPLSDRYEPYILSGYNVGDTNRKKEDMISNLTKEQTVEGVSKLHVDDCAWIRRSDGSWSYAIVKLRSDGDGYYGGDENKGVPSSITFTVNVRGSTKTTDMRPWGGHVRLPARSDVLPNYSVGDPGRRDDMIIDSRIETMKAVSKVKINDGSFVKRSDGSWVYSIVKDRCYGDRDDNRATITFQVNAEGSTKVMTLSKCGKFARRVRHNQNDGGGEVAISDEKANAIFDVIKKGQRLLM